MKRAVTFRRFARNAGAVVIGLIVLDVAATLVTLALGSEFLRR
jgi:hypothetical protein